MSARNRFLWILFLIAPLGIAGDAISGGLCLADPESNVLGRLMIEHDAGELTATPDVTMELFVFPFGRRLEFPASGHVNGVDPITDYLPICPSAPCTLS